MSAEISCDFFERAFLLEGYDVFQALSCALDVVIIYLEQKVEEGFVLFFHECGDLDLQDFWKGPIVPEG